MGNLQVITTVEATGDVPEDFEDKGYDPIRDVAVHGDQVIVLASDHHAEGSGLRLLDLDGRFLRTIAAGQFRIPKLLQFRTGGPLWSTTTTTTTRTTATTMTTNRARCSTSSTSSQATSCKVYASACNMRSLQFV